MDAFRNNAEAICCENVQHLCRASDILCSPGPTKSRFFREIPQKNVKYREIRPKYFQIHVGKTYLILILAIRPVLFTPNVQIYLETSSLQQVPVNNVPKVTAVLDERCKKLGTNPNLNSVFFLNNIERANDYPC